MMRRNHVNLFERVSDGKSIQFVHQVIQDFFVAAYLYEGPGDQEPFADAWRSISEINSSAIDELNSIRHGLSGLIAAKVPRPDQGGIVPLLPRQFEYGPYDSNSWLQLSALAGDADAIGVALTQAKSDDRRKKIEVGFALGRAFTNRFKHAFPSIRALVADDMCESKDMVVGLFMALFGITLVCAKPALLFLAMVLLIADGGDIGIACSV